ncbi:methyltransferase domain-containing protein [Kytococcus sp. Marseille-QA3725]
MTHHLPLLEPPVRCGYHAAGRCASCTLMGTPYPAQLAAKDRTVRELLAEVVPGAAWEAPVASPPEGFRARAKLVVGGTAGAPTLGILDADDQGVDLRGCGLYPEDLRPVLDRLARFVTRAALPPYRVDRRRGELKHLVVTRSPTGELMLRIVLRSEGPLGRVREHLPALLDDLPALQVVSVNLHPTHEATLAGDREIPLTEQTRLPMPMGPVTLLLGPDAFFQTNPEVARRLYARVTELLVAAGARSVADLYCGVGGFALHAAHAGLEAVGVEISADGVDSASRAALDQGLPACFVRADAADPDAVVRAAGIGTPDGPRTVVVNPPRRGLGDRLPALLDRAGAEGGLDTLVYSSCNPRTLARDLFAMPHWRPETAGLFDMFPNTEHAEVLVSLRPH